MSDVIDLTDVQSDKEDSDLEVIEDNIRPIDRVFNLCKRYVEQFFLDQCYISLSILWETSPDLSLKTTLPVIVEMVHNGDSFVYAEEPTLDDINDDVERMDIQLHVYKDSQYPLCTDKKVVRMEKKLTRLIKKPNGQTVRRYIEYAGGAMREFCPPQILGFPAREQEVIYIPKDSGVGLTRPETILRVKEIIQNIDAHIGR